MACFHATSADRGFFLAVACLTKRKTCPILAADRYGRQDMAKIHKTMAAKMMQAGDNDSKIAALFGASRQAVNLLRRSLVAEGKLAAADPGVQEGPVRHASRPTVSSGQTGQLKPDTRAAVQSSQTRPTMDQLTGWMIQIIRDAGEARQLRIEYQKARELVDELQTEVGTLRDEIRRLKEVQNPESRKAVEFQAAVENTDLPDLGEAEPTG